MTILWLTACNRPVERPHTPVDVKKNEWRYQGRKGTELLTEHYRLRTTCSYPRLLAMLPEFLESCWKSYANLVPPREGDPQAALAYLFQTRREWEVFTKAFSPQRAPTYLLIRSGGYEERGVTVSHYDRMATTLSVISHEGLHQYLELTRRGPIPPWVNEGLACYFEAFDLDPSGRAVFKPRDNLIRRNNLRDAFLNEQLFELRELLSTNAGRVVALPTERVRTYYAQTWSVVLFLLLGDPQREPLAQGFRDLLRDLGEERMTYNARALVVSPDRADVERGEAVFRAYVTDDLAAFEQRYRAFLRELLHVD